MTTNPSVLYGLIFVVLFNLVLWIAPIVAGVIIAKKKNRNPHWFWLGIIPGFGFWIFIIMLILKPLKTCSYCNKKIPADSNICPYCADKGTPVQNSAAKSEKKTIRTVIILVVSLFAVIAVLASIIFISITSSFKNSEPFRDSLTYLQENEEVSEYLGESYKIKGMISGSISTSGDSTGKASISYKIKGKNGVSRVYLKAEKENGIWDMEKLVFYKTPDSKDSINLLEDEE